MSEDNTEIAGKVSDDRYFPSSIPIPARSSETAQQEHDDDHDQHHLSSFSHHGTGHLADTDASESDVPPVVAAAVLQPAAESRENPREKDPILKAYDEIRTAIYAKYPVDLFEEAEFNEGDDVIGRGETPGGE
ncbi:hypothetical protein BV898_09047 [Hypsibius exemplaris]|uniref:Uncharacterized protein n=1 Tax=Hypsibius exemplaris TaxID=2072580 RepID=A0A1W0WNZ4_HYPEX|nr:hypothetical protein BV898_09047 [Hypsibius exemplaris]